MMPFAKKSLIVLIVATLGLWGCAQNPTSGSSSSSQNDRIKALEAKNAKLEDDFRAAATTRDQARKRLTLIEEEQKQLREQMDDQVQALIRERDELKQQLSQRTTERDLLMAQCEQFRRGLKDLLGQVEAAIIKPSDEPITSAAGLTLPGKL